jgi:hypothetical protein
MFPNMWETVDKREERQCCDRRDTFIPNFGSPRRGKKK